MPTGNRREDSFVDLFLSAYEGGSWRDAYVDRPEKTQDNAVEAIARRRSDNKTVAIEHTIIEPFVGEKADLAQFAPAFEKLKRDKSFLVPNRITRVFVPVGILDGQKPAARQAIVNGLGSWLKAKIALLPEGWSKAECRIEISGKWPLHVILNLEVLPTRNFTSFLIAPQQVSVDLKKVLEKALRKKLPKLVKAQAVRRILMLEREHMNLLPKQIMAKIEQLHPTFPDLAKVDEIWCVETIFYEREGVIHFFRYDAEGHTLAEIAYWGGRVQISRGPTW